MNSLVVYGSRHGNTHKVAEAIAFELGKHGAVQLVSAEDARTVLPAQLDLVVVGGPTEAHRITEPVAQFFDRVGKDALVGVAAATFDTRLRWPEWLSGSAAAGIAHRLQQARANVIGPWVSFFVSGKLPVLEPGEIERAAAWAASLAARLESVPVTRAARPVKADHSPPVSKGPEALRPFPKARRPLRPGTKHLIHLCRMARVSRLADLLTCHQDSRPKARSKPCKRSKQQEETS